MIRKLLIPGAIGALVLFIAIQFVPYGRAHTNSPVVQEPKWDSPQTRELAIRACFNCHSNQTEWPGYSSIAPVSWLLYRDVIKGREKLNFSEWHLVQRKRADDAQKKIEKGEMPQWYYVLVHPEANLTAAEKKALIDGLRATILAQ
jgi:hypothetical protein